MNKTILFVGNFSSAHIGNFNIIEQYSKGFTQSGWNVIETTHKENILVRLLDMIYVVLSRRKDYQLACVTVFSGKAFIWAEVVSFILSCLRKPFILSLHGGALPEFSKKYPKRVQKLFQKANAVTAPSSYLANQIQVTNIEISILPNPINLEKYPFQLKTSPRPKIIWNRAFHKIYQPHMALHVINELVLQQSPHHLTMIGPDRGDGSFQDCSVYVREKNLEDFVQFLGAIPHEQIAQQLSKGDIFLNTSKIDNTPLSVLEAMACGLCIISTNVGGIPYMLEHEKDALLVEPGDSQAMVKSVKRLLADQDLAKKLSQNARKKAEQFDWARIFPEWSNLIQKIV